MKTLNHTTGMLLITLSTLGLAAMLNAILDGRSNLWMLPIFIAFASAIKYGDKLLKKTIKTE